MKDRSKFYCPVCGERYVVTVSGYVACMRHGPLKMMREWEKEQLAYVEKADGLPQAIRISRRSWSLMCKTGLFRRAYPVDGVLETGAFPAADDAMERIIYLKPWKKEPGNEGSAKSAANGPVLDGDEPGGVGRSEPEDAVGGESGAVCLALPGMVLEE